MAVRETIALLGMGTLGGAWAVAWGTKRVQRPQRVAMLDARTQMQVQLDALRARTGILTRHPELTPEARGILDEVVESEVLIDSVLARAAQPSDVIELADEVTDAFHLIEQAGAIVGLDLPAANRFSGLCRTDPQHGVTEPQGALCEECAAATMSGSPPPRRQVTEGGRPLDFDAVELPPTDAP